MYRFAIAVSVLVLVGCASTPKAPTLNDLEGKWEGEWTWKSKSGSFSNSGEAKFAAKRIDEETWNLDITAVGSAIPDDNFVINVEQSGPNELTGEYQGGTMTLTVTPGKKGQTSDIAIELAHPKIGDASVKGTLSGDLIRVKFTETRSDGSGTITLERVKE